MKTTPLFLLTFALTSCTLDDLAIPDPLPPAEDDGGDDEDTGDDNGSSSGESGQAPEPDPLVPGAWAPCDGWDDQSCDPSELGCFMPVSEGVELTGHCTWICADDEDCADLAVDGLIPQCLPYKTRTSACQLPCSGSEECPEGMACKAIEVYQGGQTQVCVWADEVIQ